MLLLRTKKISRSLAENCGLCSASTVWVRRLTVPVVGSLAGRESITGRVGLLNRDSFRLGPRGSANPKLFRGLTPVGARLEPGEIDPLAVGAPVDVVGLPAIELRTAHDIFHGEVEWPRSLRGNRLHGKQQ